MPKKLYVRTTMDKYELPIAVADSPGELARMMGTTSNSVSSAITHKKRGWFLVVVDVEEGEVL